MNKSIYEEALEILVDSLQDPQDEDDDCYMLDLKQINKISMIIDQARKQDELLELYRKLMTVKDELLSLGQFDEVSEEAIEIETDLEKQIKEIEK